MNELLQERMQGALLELRKAGAEWQVVLIEQGWSKNRGPHGQRYYTEESLKGAAPLFEGTQACVYKFGDTWRRDYNHLPVDLRVQQPPGGLMQNTVGWFTEVRYGPFKRRNGSTGNGLVARLRIAESATWLRQLLRDAWEHGREILGLSIDARGESEQGAVEGKAADKVVEIKQVNSVDLVSNAAAGGGLLALVASVDHNGRGQTEEVTMDPILQALTDMGAQWTEGFEFGEQTGDDARDLAVQVLEAVRERAKGSMDGITETPALGEATAGLAEINKALALLKEGKAEDAIKLLQDLKGKLGTDEEKPFAVPVEEKVETKEATPVAPAPAPVVTPAPAPVEATPAVTPAPAAVQEAKDMLAKMKALQEQLEADRAETEKERQAAITQQIGTLVTESKCRDKVLDALREEVAERGDTLTIESARKIVTRYEALQGQLSETAATPVVLGQAGRVELGDAPADKIQKMMDLAMDPSLAETKGYESLEPIGLRESYEMFMGPASWGQAPSQDSLAQFRESLSTSLRETVSTSTWDKAFGDSITRLLQKEWALPGFQWEAIAKMGAPLKDFRTQRRIRVYDYGDLSTVGEGSDYPALTDPSDEEETYAPAKRGGIMSVTWEAILADDLGAIQRKVKSLGRSANRTLNQNVFDQLLGYSGGVINAYTMSDGYQIYDATNHGTNTADAALSYSALLTAITAMRKQTDTTSGELLGIAPKYLVVPVELEDTAMQAVSAPGYPSTSSATVGVNTVARYIKPENVIVCDYLESDINNWYLVADPKVWDGIEVAFVGGQKAPIVETQGQTTVGQVFTSDTIRYRVRFAWGAGVLDWRPFYGGLKT